MKIALIRQKLVAGAGGAGRYTMALLRGLRAAGHEIHAYSGQAAAELAEEGVVLHRVPAFGVFPFMRLLTFAWFCRRAVCRGNCDLIYSNEPALMQDVCRSGSHREWLAQRARTLSRWKRGSVMINPLHRAKLFLERRAFDPARTRALICNSHRGKAEIARLYGFPKERIHVVHNGVDCERFTVPDRSGRGAEFTLAFVGSGFERKGLRAAVGALAHLPPDVRLMVAGKGDSRACERLAAGLGVRDRVSFLGVSSRVADLYARADLLVHPALYEPFSNACLEALASGLPVVTTRLNGASEILSVGIDGAVLEDPHDVAALAAAIRPFLNRDHLALASAAARKKAESLPVSRNVRLTIEVLQRVADEKAARNPSPAR